MSCLQYVVGLDASLTCTGITRLSSIGETQYFEVKTPSRGNGLQDRFKRYRSGVSSILDQCGMWENSSLGIDYKEIYPSLILIEGYAYRGQGSSLVSLAEHGTLLRRELMLRWQNPGLLREVPPSTLKQFSCGKGNATKIYVATALAKRYEREFKSDDEADSFALAKLAAMVVGFEKPQVESQRKAVAVVKAVIQKETSNHATSTPKSRQN